MSLSSTLRGLYWFAAIVSCVILLLQYFKIEPNALDLLPKQHQASAAVEISQMTGELEKEFQSHPDLKRSYVAASSISSDYSQAAALTKVVDTAIEADALEVAVYAAIAINNKTSKTRMLEKVLDVALRSTDSFNIAVIAADSMTSDYARDAALSRVVDAYEKLNKETGLVSTVPENHIDQYKEIFKFADSNQYLSYSEEDAKLFADDWFSSGRSYESFLSYKEIYTFADSSSGMSMWSDSASRFAFCWIGTFSEDEFTYFKDAFRFAYGNHSMDMSDSDAKLFAYEKLRMKIGCSESPKQNRCKATC